MAKIILVEDEINIASFIERGLREFGHEVSVVYDVNAGWELLQNESFDLLILDIIMPVSYTHLASADNPYFAILCARSSFYSRHSAPDTLCL